MQLYQKETPTQCKILRAPVPKNICERPTASVSLKSKLKRMQFAHQPETFNFRIYKVFSYLCSFANFSSTIFIFAFASFSLTKRFQCFVLNGLNRLNALSPYQKSVPIDNARVQALFCKAV